MILSDFIITSKCVATFKTISVKDGDGRKNLPSERRKRECNNRVGKVKEKKKLVVLYNRSESAHVQFNRILRSISVDDVSTQAKVKGLIRTKLNIWRSSCEVDKKAK